jgi:hypothetical protein
MARTKTAKIKVPGTKKSVRMVNGHPDLRTKEGQKWKKANGGKAQAERELGAHPVGRAVEKPDTAAAMREEVGRLSQCIRRTELTIRAYAQKLHPGMRARQLQALRAEVLHEADRLFYVLHPIMGSGE